MMKVFMTGGTGFVGTALMPKLTEQGYEVTLLTRSIRKDRFHPAGVSLLEGDSTKKGTWQESVPGHDIFINLAGASIFARWTRRRKKMIRDSRLLTTQNLVDALSGRKDKETLLLSTSAVGYYGYHGDEELDESSPPGNDFLASVTSEWEAEAVRAQTYGVRVLLCRLGIVLGSKGGALDRMIPLFKWYLGSPLGNGEQWFSWIHEQDLANIYLFLINQKDISGPINCTAPYPVTNREMTRAMAEVLNRHTLIPSVPGFMIKLLLGEFGSTLIDGQKVLPGKLLEAGFQFRFSNISQALEDLLKEKNNSYL